MRSILYLVAVIFVILWVVGFLFHGLGTFGDGGIIHVLLVIAIIALILGVIRRA
ncbi:lmo0937 family membrane protein [Mucilaginibacter sp. CSA2-8R]|uniref:lmo0937 family membrane protein n=1 Tax=Mucilaginibacter sp. CSA2-8R TaxID=3141542 RepID=UPI00315DB711